MASVEKRGENSWRIGILAKTDNGRKWIRKTLTFPPSMPQAQQRARAEMEALRMQLEKDAGKELQPVDTSITVRDFAEIWMTEHVIPTLAPTTAKNYRFFLDSRIIPALGDTRLAKLTPMQLTRFINSLRTDTARTTAIPAELRKRKADRERAEKPPHPLSPKTIRHYYDCLDFMLGKAVQWQYIEENPMSRVDRPKVRRNAVKSLDDAQSIALLRCLALEDNLSFRCSVLLALLCGLRLGEVCALTFDDVDWDACTINVHNALKYTPATGSYIAEPKTDAGVRIIELPAGMMALLHETHQYQLDAEVALGDRWHGTGRIVTTWDGKPVHHDTPSRWFRAFADKNGFTGTRFHDLRHTHATLLFASNIDAVAIASRLGHEDASTTLRIYAHAIRKRDRDSADAMQRLLMAAYHPSVLDPDDDQTDI